MIEFKDQSCDILEYNLFDKTVDTNQFTVLQEKMIKFKEHEVKIGIIGESHFFSIDDSLTEVLACVNVKEDSVFRTKFNEGFSVVKEINGLFIATRIEIFDKNKDIDHLLHYFSIDPSLHVEFPSTENLPFKPVTVIKVANRDRMLVFESLHAYPNENRVVYSISSVI